MTGYFAPTSRYGTPDEFRAFVDRLHARGPRRDPRLGAGALPARRLRARALRRHRALRARGSAPRRASGLGHARLQLRPHRGAQLPRRERALLARASTTPTACASTPSRRCSTATTRARRASGCRTQYGGREDLEAIAFLARAQRGRPRPRARARSWPPRSRPPGRASRGRPTLGGLGFGFKWNMGWMHDTLEYFQRDPVHRRHHHDELTFSLMYAFTENFVLPLSHDEVVHGKGSLLDKMPGDRWQQLANLRALYGYMWAHPGKKLLFMGGELAQEREWSHDRSLDWHLLERPEHAGVQALVGDLNRVYRDEPALWELDFEPDGFAWLELERRGRQRDRVRALLDARATASSSASATSRRCRARLPLGCRAAGAWRELLEHRRDRLRRLGRRSTPARSRPRRPPGTASSVGRADAAAARRRLARAGPDVPRPDDPAPLSLAGAAVPARRDLGRRRDELLRSSRRTPSASSSACSTTPAREAGRADRAHRVPLARLSAGCRARAALRLPRPRRVRPERRPPLQPREAPDRPLREGDRGGVASTCNVLRTSPAVTTEADPTDDATAIPRCVVVDPGSTGRATGRSRRRGTRP